MASKTNGFYVFVTKYKNEQTTVQNKSISFQQLVEKLKPVWNVSNNIRI